MRGFNPSFGNSDEQVKTHGFRINKQIQNDDDYVVCDDYTIIQKYTRLYGKCNEYKFSVLNDKIICVSSIPPSETINYEDEINPHILKFVMDVVEIIKRKWPNYFYVRIDIMIECNKRDPSAILYTSSDITPNMYLNEIEPLGSGLKRFCLNIESNKIKEPTGKFLDPYEDIKLESQIATELVEIIERNLIGGRKQKKYKLVKL